MGVFNLRGKVIQEPRLVTFQNGSSATIVRVEEATNTKTASYIDVYFNGDAQNCIPKDIALYKKDVVISGYFYGRLSENDTWKMPIATFRGFSLVITGGLDTYDD